MMNSKESNVHKDQSITSSLQEIRIDTIAKMNAIETKYQCATLERRCAELEKRNAQLWVINTNLREQMQNALTRYEKADAELEEVILSASKQFDKERTKLDKDIQLLEEKIQSLEKQLLLYEFTERDELVKQNLALQELVKSSHMKMINASKVYSDHIKHNEIKHKQEIFDLEKKHQQNTVNVEVMAELKEQVAFWKAQTTWWIERERKNSEQIEEQQQIYDALRKKYLKLQKLKTALYEKNEVLRLKLQNNEQDKYNLELEVLKLQSENKSNQKNQKFYAKMVTIGNGGILGQALVVDILMCSIGFPVLIEQAHAECTTFNIFEPTNDISIHGQNIAIACLVILSISILLLAGFNKAMHDYGTISFL